MAGSRTEKHTAVYRNVKRCEFHNIGDYIVVTSIIGGTTFCAFFDWNVWRDMKEMYGRQYLKPDDIEEYKVKFDGAVHFLMHTEELKGAYENAERKR